MPTCLLAEAGPSSTLAYLHLPDPLCEALCAEADDLALGGLGWPA